MVVHSAKEYKDAIEFLYHNPSERKRLGDNAQTYVKENLGIQNTVKYYHDIYKNLMDHKKNFHSWGKDCRAPLLEQPIFYQDITGKCQKISASELFIRSLGNNGKIFSDSIEHRFSIDVLFETDQKIGRVSENIFRTGILRYQEYDPTDKYLNFWVGLVYRHRSDNHQTIFHLVKAHEQGFEHWRLYWYLANTLKNAGQLSESDKVLQHLFNIQPDYQQQLQDAGLLVSDNNKAEVQPFSNDLIHKMIYESKDIYKIRNSDQTHHVNQKTAEQMYHEIQIFLKQGKHEAAIEAYQKMLDKYPNFALAHNDLGVLYNQVGKHKRARNYFQKAVSLQPENITFQKNFADFCYAILHQVEEALQIYTNILKTHPDDIETITRLGKICIDLNKMDDARHFFKQIIKLDSSNAEAQYALRNLQSVPQNNSPKETAIETTVKGNDVDEPFLVSAIVSTYNSEKFIEGCLDDLLKQTIADKLEIIVVNSGSEQNEEAVIKKYQEKHASIKYIRTEQRETLYESWNRGIKIASGKYITNANTDDRHRKDALEILAKTLDNHPSAGLAYGDVLITENENETFGQNTAHRCYIFPEFSRRQMLARQFFGPQPMWRKSVHDKIGYFHPRYVVCGDWEFFIRLGTEFDAVHVPEFLGLYCRRNDSVERSNKDKNQKEQREIYDQYRNAIALEKIYPNLKNQNVDGEAFAAAYTDLGNIFIMSSRDFKSAQIAYEKGLKYKANACELLNNLMLCILLENKIIPKHSSIDVFQNNSDQTDTFNCLKSNLPNIKFGMNKYTLMAVSHPVLNKLPPVCTGSLEHTLNDGSKIQRPSKYNDNETALKRFKSALTEFKNGNFLQSELLVREYRDLVNYNNYTRADNRDSANPQISVIIVSYHKNGELLECINSVERQTTNSFEVIVIDNGNNSSVENTLKEKNILYLKSPINFFPAEGRNIGAYFARGAIIAFLDDDAIVNENYIDSIRKAFETYKICGFRGKIIPKSDNMFNKDAGHYNLGDIPIPNSIDIEGNSAFIKEVYRKMNGMNPILFGCEGLDFSYRISKKYGVHATIYWPQTIIYHDFAANEDKYQNKLKRHDFSKKYLLEKYPDIYDYFHFLNSYSQNIQLAHKGESLITRQ